MLIPDCLHEGDSLLKFVNSYTAERFAEDAHQKQLANGLLPAPRSEVVECFEVVLSDCKREWFDPSDAWKVGFQFPDYIVNLYSDLIYNLAMAKLWSLRSENYWVRMDNAYPDLNLNDCGEDIDGKRAQLLYIYNKKIRYAEFRSAYFVMDFEYSIRLDDGAFDELSDLEGETEAEAKIRYIGVMKRKFAEFTKNPEKYRRDRNESRETFRLDCIAHDAKLETQRAAYLASQAVVNNTAGGDGDVEMGAEMDEEGGLEEQGGFEDYDGMDLD